MASQPMYKTITVRTVTDLKRLERLVKQGWSITSYGFDTYWLKRGGV